MSQTKSWDFARDILTRRFKGVRHPLFFGNSLTVDEQTNVRGKPRPYILSAIELLKQMQGKTIVEIGCMRQPMNHSLDQFVPYCCNDGHSTMFWASTGLDVHTVDINPRSIEIVKQSCAAHPNVHATCGDGVQFVRDFPGTIDLLFLDAWDADEGSPFAEKHLEAYQAARDKLAPSSLVLIDDTDVSFGGKGRLTIPAVIRDGFELLLIGRQTMLLRVP